MKPQYRPEDFVLKDVLIKMLRILYSIAQDLEKLRNIKSLHIKHRYGFDELVPDDTCYEENEEDGDLVSVDNILPSKENMNWPFMSTTILHIHTSIWINCQNLMTILILWNKMR